MQNKKIAKSKKIDEKIIKALNKIRPSLQADGGDVQFVKWDERTGTVAVELTGHCAHCPMAQMTLKQGIEKLIIDEVPEVKEVVNI